MSKRKKFIEKLAAVGRGAGKAELMSDGSDLFVLLDGSPIAQRGRPGTEQAGQWVSTQPGYRVIDSVDGSEIHIEISGIAIH